MNKSKVYLILLGAITAFVVWDMADSFVGGLGFPRGDWEQAYTWLVPFVLIVLVIFLQPEKDKNE